MLHYVSNSFPTVVANVWMFIPHSGSCSDCAFSPKALFLVFNLFNFFSFWGCPCTVAKVTWRILGAALGFWLSIKAKDALNSSWHTWQSDGSCVCVPGVSSVWVLPGLHMWIYVRVCVPVPRHIAVRNKAGFSSHPCAVTQISNWPTVSWTQVLWASLYSCFLSFSLLFSLCTLAFVGWLAGRKAPAHLLYRPRETQLRAKSVQNVKHRWPLTHKWVHGKRESLLCQILQSPLAFFYLFIFSPALCLIYQSSSSFFLLLPKLSLLTCFHLTHSSPFSSHAIPHSLSIRGPPSLFGCLRLLVRVN